MRRTITSAAPRAARWVGWRPGLLSGIVFAALFWFPVFAEQGDPEMVYADALFKQKKFIEAARQYRTFVEKYPSSEKALTGWFQLGESYREGDQLREARETFRQLVDKYRKGPEVGAASYRLGILNFNANDFNSAVMDFELASREADSPKLQYQARYYNARSLQMIQKDDLALALYDQLMRTNPGPETNHFLEKSILESARIHLDRGDNETGQQLLQKLIETGTTISVREEAVVRSALASVSCGKIDEGEDILKRSSQFQKDSPWSALAEVGSLFIAYARKDYDRVVSIYSSGTIISSAGEYRPRVLLMVADAFNAKGDDKAADRLYTLVEQRYPTAEAGVEAGYRKLTVLYKENSGTLPTEVEKYTARLGAFDPGNQYIDKACLMLGEWHFFQAEKGVVRKDLTFADHQYRFAAAAYRKIREENLTDDIVPTMLFHLSWASLESSDIVTGAQAVTTLMEKFPESEFVSSALAKRGETYLQREDFNSALQDFEAIINRYPDSSSLEIAMERRGRIYAHKRRLPEMVSAYETLLSRFPETESKAEAHFWIGEGYFEQEKYIEAIPHFEKASSLDPDSYANKAGIRSILSNYSLNRIPEMTQAARIYIQSGRDAGVLTARQKTDKPLQIPTHVLIHLGEKLAEKNQYSDAEFFLKRVVTPDAPAKTEAKVWKLWAMIKLNLKDYENAIAAFDQFLIQTREPSQRGYAYVNRGRAQFALEQYDHALISARECIRVVKQGRINAEARMLIGDIASAKGELEVAAQEYYLVSQIFNDPQFTPQALQKAIQLQQKLGDSREAGRLELKLKEQNDRKR